MASRRLNAQTPEAVLTARADYILPNTSTREALAKAANELCDALIGEEAALENAVPTAAQTGGAGLHRGSAPDGSAAPCPGGRPAALPRKYSQQVEQWAAEYELDPLLVYAFIRTESGFDPAATSSVEARG